MVNKTVTIVNAQNGEENWLRIGPGTKPQDIFRQLAVPKPERHRLARISGRKVLPADCDVSRVVNDRERLFLILVIEVGRRA